MALPEMASLPSADPGGPREKHSKAAKPSRQEARPVAPKSDSPDTAAGASWAKELESLENSIRLRNYSPRTAKTYMGWTRKFQTYTRSKPPADLSTEDVKAFLTDLAVLKNVAASTQNQAFNALLYFFRHVLGKEFGKVEGVVRAKRRRYIPVVLSRKEIDAVVARLAHPHDFVALLLYGCGLRISEALDLRIQCFNLERAVNSQRIAQLIHRQSVAQKPRRTCGCAYGFAQSSDNKADARFICAELPFLGSISTNRF